MANQVHLWQLSPVCEIKTILRCCLFSHSLVITLKMSWHWMIVFSHDLIHLRIFILETSRTLMVMCGILYGYIYVCS